MRLMPETRNRRLLAIVLLLIVAMLVYLIVFHWWFVAPQLDISAQMDDLREQQQRFSQIAQERPLIDKRVAEVRTFEQSNQSFLTDSDPNAAFSDLTQRLKQVISQRVKDENRCSIVSNSNFKGGEEELYRRVTIQVRMRCALEPFAGILYDLENSNPYLFVDQMMIYRQQAGYIPPGGKPPPSALDIRFNLSGYLRNKTGKAGE
ncbi:MAG: type II secretion system protein GspM [Rudaea sp.]